MIISDGGLMKMTQELFHGTTAVSDSSNRNEPVKTYPEATENKIAWLKVKCLCCVHKINQC